MSDPCNDLDAVDRPVITFSDFFGGDIAQLEGAEGRRPRSRSGSWIESISKSVSSKFRSTTTSERPSVKIHVALGDAEKLTMQEQLLRASHGEAPPVSTVRTSSSMVSTFVSCGLPQRNENPCPLATLGDESQIPPGLVHFLFPSQSIPVTEHGAQLNSCLPALLFPIQERPDDTFFVVLTSSDQSGARITTYGVAALQTLPVGWKSLQAETNGAGIALPVATAPVCFVVLSQFPYFSMHMDVLHYWVETERRLALSAVSSEAVTGTGTTGPAALLKAYIRAQMPKPDADFVFQFPAAAFVSKFHLPAVNTEADLIARLGLPVLMTVAPDPALFVRLLTLVLLERKLAVVCEHSLRLCSVLPLALLALVQPFAYQGTFISLVPRSLLELLSAPVPFVVGVPVPGATEAALSGKLRPATGRWFKRRLSQQSKSPPRSAAVQGDNEPPLAPFPADVVAAVVTAKSSAGQLVLDLAGGDDCPALPGGAKLISTLLPHFEAMQRLVARERQQHDDAGWLPYRLTGQMLPVVQAVSVEVSDCLHSLVAEFRAHCIRNATNPEKPVTAFVRDTFVRNRPADEQPFLSSFVETQGFAVFEEKRLRSIDNL